MIASILKFKDQVVEYNVIESCTSQRSIEVLAASLFGDGAQFTFSCAPIGFINKKMTARSSGNFFNDAKH